MKLSEIPQNWRPDNWLELKIDKLYKVREKQPKLKGINPQFLTDFVNDGLEVGADLMLEVIIREVIENDKAK